MVVSAVGKLVLAKAVILAAAVMSIVVLAGSNIMATAMVAKVIGAAAVGVME